MIRLIITIISLLFSPLTQAKCIFDTKAKAQMQETLSQIPDVNVKLQIEWAAKQCASLDKSISSGAISREPCTVNGTAKLYGNKFNICKWQESSKAKDSKATSQSKGSSQPHYYFQ